MFSLGPLLLKRNLVYEERVSRVSLNSATSSNTLLVPSIYIEAVIRISIYLNYETLKFKAVRRIYNSKVGLYKAEIEYKQ